MNYTFWEIRMKTYIQSLGANVWDTIQDAYNKPPYVSTRDQKLELT